MKAVFNFILTGLAVATLFIGLLLSAMGGLTALMASDRRCPRD